MVKSCACLQLLTGVKVTQGSAKSPARRITETRIVNVSAQLFARNGFKASTTREIAQLAGISEVTLFRYFTGKSDLFEVVLKTQLARWRMGQELELSLAADADPALVVPQIVSFLLQNDTQQLEMRRLLHVAMFEVPQVGKLIQERLVPTFDTISAYFKRVFEKRGIKNADPMLVTLGLVGAVSAHQNLYLLLTGKNLDSTDSVKAIEFFSQMWLQLIR